MVEFRTSVQATYNRRVTPAATTPSSAAPQNRPRPRLPPRRPPRARGRLCSPRGRGCRPLPPTACPCARRSRRAAPWTRSWRRGGGEEVGKVAVAVLAAGRGAWWSRGHSHSPEALHACGRDSCPESKWSLKRQCLRRCLGSVSEVSGTCHLSGEASDASDWTLARSPSGAAGLSGGGSSSGESSIASASSDGGHQSSATAGMPAPWTRTSQRGEDGICKGYAQASTAEYSRTPLQPCPLER